MVELQIVILAVAGSSPVGHPSLDFGLRKDGWPLAVCDVAHAVLQEIAVLMPATSIDSHETRISATDFWLRILHDEQLRNCDNLQKLLVGCEIIAALDGVDLLAA